MPYAMILGVFCGNTLVYGLVGKWKEGIAVGSIATVLMLCFHFFGWC